MLTVSIPKLLQESHELQRSSSAAEMESKIAALQSIISELDKVNANRTQLVNSKSDQAQYVSDYIVQVRAVVKGILGSDSSEYEMIGGTRASERKKPKRKAEYHSA